MVVKRIDLIDAPAEVGSDSPAGQIALTERLLAGPAAALLAAGDGRVADGGDDAIKVVVDFALSLVLLVAFAPVILAAAVLVRLTSPGPAFYRQDRLGRGGRVFRIWKIRTMTRDAERETGPCWATPRDKRVTRVGAFLRRTHLDELPQLVNVLRGEMSLVGPRPERPEFLDRLVAEVPGYLDRLAVRPGVTGVAQLHLPPDTDMESVRRKLTYDRYYLRHRGLGLDLRLIACTSVKLFGIPPLAVIRLFGLPGRDAIESDADGLANRPATDLQMT